MNKKKLNVKKVLIVVVLLLIIIVLFPFKENRDDFKIKVDGKEYDVIVAKPKEKLSQYPLVIYHHGGGYKTIEPFELRNLSKEFAKEGFLFWAPERTPWSITKSKYIYEEAENISKAVSNVALNDTKVNKNKIYVVGFSMGSLVALNMNAKSGNVNKLILIGFGAPYDDALMYKYFKVNLNKTNYSRIKPKILIMLSQEDEKVDINDAETLRKNLIEANKDVDCVVYEKGGHLSLVGVKNYINDVIKYLKNEEINITEKINVDKQLRAKYERYASTGYW